QKEEIDYIELRQLWIGNIIEVDDQTLEDARDIIQDAGLKVSSIASPLLKCIPPSVNPEPKNPTNYTKNWKYNYSKFEHILEIADFFKAKYIRVFAYEGLNDKDFPWQVPPIEEWDSWQVYKDWSDIIRKFKQKAYERGHILVCENDSGFNKTFEQVEKIGRDHSDKSFGMLLDTGNAAIHSEKYVLNDEWFERLMPYIKYIHAKGVKYDGDHKRVACPVNDPDDICLWPEVIQKLRNYERSNFVGGPLSELILSIETHMGKKNRWENSTKSLRNLKELIRGK
ncbi:MAG: sugar phosphate isomerase/epimerase family protein, partial [Promethearchaeota archaeon]